MSVVLISAYPPDFGGANSNPEIGTGFIVAQNGTTSILLTCWHVVSRKDTPVPIKINGVDPVLIRHPELERRDLVLLALPRLAESPQSLSTVNLAPGTPLTCSGFSDYIRKEYSLREVKGTLVRDRKTVDQSGLKRHYHELNASPGGDFFAAGMSGGPLYNAFGHVVGVFRLRDGSEPKADKGSAISLNPEIVSFLRSAIGNDFSLQVFDHAESQVIPPQSGAIDILRESPPLPPHPREQSRRNHDIQKNRWGGRSVEFGRRLFIENVRHLKHGSKKYFEFDAVLESKDGTSLQGPFFFHLDETYVPGKIRIVKTRSDGKRTVLEDIGSDGTYTIGVQFKDADGEWHSLEYDLTRFANGVLTKYDRWNQ